MCASVSLYGPHHLGQAVLCTVVPVTPGEPYQVPALTASGVGCTIRFVTAKGIENETA